MTHEQTPDHYETVSTDPIEAVENLLETVPKHARALAGVQLPEGYAAWVGRDADAILVTLEGAIGAE